VSGCSGIPQAAYQSADNVRMNAESASLLRRLLLGSVPKRQLRTSLALMALVVYVAFAGLQHAEVLLGLIDPAESAALTLFYVGGGLVFYALIRSANMPKTRTSSSSVITAPRAGPVMA
jgi:hypothetical protein